MRGGGGEIIINGFPQFLGHNANLVCYFDSYLEAKSIIIVCLHYRYFSINIKVQIHHWNATIWSSNGSIDNDNNYHHHYIRCHHRNLGQIKKTASSGSRASKSQNN